MKRITKIFVLVIASMAALYSCSKENVDKAEGTVLKATFEGMTKTSLGTEYQVLWSVNDDIVYFDVDGNAYTSTSTTVSDDGLTAEFTFASSIASGDVALYPADENAEYDPDYGVIGTTLPATQYPVAGGFDPKANIALSETVDNTAKFYNACTLIGFKIMNDDIKEITLRSSKAFAGKCTVSPTYGGAPEISLDNDSPSDLVLLGDFVKGQVYYAVVVPNEYITFDLTFKRGDGNVAKFENNNTLDLTEKRNCITMIFDSEIPDSKWEAEPTSFTIPEGDYAVLAKRSIGNYWFMTSDLGTATTKRLQAVLSGYSTLPESVKTDAENIWTVAKSGAGYVISQNGKYITWTSGNSSALDGTGKVLTVAQSVDDALNIFFNVYDETDVIKETRYLSLNSNAGTDYFAFYANTDQVTDLYLVPAEVDTTPAVILDKEEISEVPSAGVTDAVENGVYNLKNAVDADVTVGCDGTVVTAASIADGALTYTVSTNSGDARDGWVSLTLSGVESKVTVSQLAAGASASKTWTYEVVSGSPTLKEGTPVTVNGATWSIAMGEKVGSPTANGEPASFNIYGWKWGNSKSAYWSSYTLSTDYFTSKKVKSVTVKFLNNGAKEGTMVVMQGSTTIGTASASFGQTWTELTAYTNQGIGGTLSIQYTVAQASYINTITVEYYD